MSAGQARRTVSRRAQWFQRPLAAPLAAADAGTYRHDPICLNPVFSRVFSARTPDDYKAVYPYGTELDNDGSGDN